MSYLNMQFYEVAQACRITRVLRVPVHERLKDKTTVTRASMSEGKNEWLGEFYRAIFSEKALKATIILTD